MKENPDTYEEQNLFVESDHMKQVISNVNAKLGFDGDNPATGGEMLNFEDTLLIYDTCRFEDAWYPHNVSYWCAAFSTDDLKVNFM